MNPMPIILIYLVLGIVDIAPLIRKKEKRKMLIYIIFLVIPLVLSINIIIGVDMPSINSIIGKLLLPIVKQA